MGAASLFVSSSAHAQDASYTVVTNDGSTYQGQLVENVVGQHVTLKLISGEIRIIQSSDVKAQGPSGSTTVVTTTVPNVPTIVAQEQAALQTLTQLQAGAPGGPPIAYTGADAVQIHIERADANEGGLFMESQSGWARVCTMPCSTTVDPKIDYKLYNSDPFRFPQSRGPLDLVADNSGRRAFRTLGAIITPVSLVGELFGILVAANVFTSDPTPNTPAEMKAQSNAQSANLAAGLTIIGASTALLTVGIIFLALRPSPTLTTRTGERIVQRGTIPLGRTLALTPTGMSF